MSTIQPLVVSPKEAGVMLGYGNTRIYELISSGELRSYKDGTDQKSPRRILVKSIHDYIERRLAAQSE